MVCYRTRKGSRLRAKMGNVWGMRAKMGGPRDTACRVLGEPQPWLRARVGNTQSGEKTLLTTYTLQVRGAPGEN